MRVKLTISYDGSKFRGFQAQRDGTATVANTIESAFASLGIKEKFNASGRTDSGVHAINQVVDIKLPPYWSDLNKLKTMLNRRLHPSIHIKSIVKVKDSFHARFSAKKRQYRYIIKQSDFCVFSSPYYLFYDKSIDLTLLSTAMKLYEGEHDFRYFMKSGSDTTTTKRAIYKSRVYRYKDMIIFSFTAQGYLRSQIRMMVAFLLQINEKKLSIKNLEDQLLLDEVYSCELVEPNGLYLTRIWY